MSIDIADDLHDGANRAASALPPHIRLISQSRLVEEGGQDAIMRAAADIWQQYPGCPVREGCASAESGNPPLNGGSTSFRGLIQLSTSGLQRYPPAYRSSVTASTPC